MDLRSTKAPPGKEHLVTLVYPYPLPPLPLQPIPTLLTLRLQLLPILLRRLWMLLPLPLLPLHMRMFPQRLIKSLPLHTLLIMKAPRTLLQILHAHASEQFREFIAHHPTEERLVYVTQEVPFQAPGTGIRVFGLWTDLFHPRHKRIESGFGLLAGVDAPGVEAEFSLFLEKGRDGRVPFGLWVCVEHALNADVFVEPDGPAGRKGWGG